MKETASAVFASEVLLWQLIAGFVIIQWPLVFSINFYFFHSCVLVVPVKKFTKQILEKFKWMEYTSFVTRIVFSQQIKYGERTVKLYPKLIQTTHPNAFIK